MSDHASFIAANTTSSDPVTWHSIYIRDSATIEILFHYHCVNLSTPASGALRNAAVYWDSRPRQARPPTVIFAIGEDVSLNTLRSLSIDPVDTPLQLARYIEVSPQECYQVTQYWLQVIRAADQLAYQDYQPEFYVFFEAITQENHVAGGKRMGHFVNDIEPAWDRLITLLPTG